LVRNDGEVKEMITGVGNDQFMWMYAIGFGILRAPEAFAYLFRTVRHAGMDFEVAWGDISWIQFLSV